MDNPKKLATLDTQDTGRRQREQQTQHRKLKWRGTRIPQITGGEHRRPRRANNHRLPQDTGYYSYSQYMLERHHYAKTNTNNVDKTWALLQTTGGKDKPNIAFMWKSLRWSERGSQNVKIYDGTMLDITMRKQTQWDISPSTNNWRERWTEHRRHAETTTDTTTRNQEHKDT